MGCRSSKTAPIDLRGVHTVMEPYKTRPISMSIFTHHRSSTVMGKSAELPQVQEISYSQSLSVTFQGSSEQLR